MPVPEPHLTPAAGEPTAHPPGSPGKVAALAARAARREPLFHPGDAPGEGRAPDPRAGPAASRPAPGVRRRGRRWQARVYVRGLGQVHVGCFATEAEAREAARRFREAG